MRLPAPLRDIHQLLNRSPLAVGVGCITALLLLLSVFVSTHELAHATAAVGVGVPVREIHLTSLAGFHRPFTFASVRWYADATEVASVRPDFSKVSPFSLRAAIVYAAGPAADLIACILCLLAWRRAWVKRSYFVSIVVWLSLFLAISVLVNINPKGVVAGQTTDGAKIFVAFQHAMK